MKSRFLAAILISAAVGGVTAQAMPGALTTRSPVVDLVTMITALKQMETTTDHPLEARQAATVLVALQELRDATALTPEHVEAVLQLVTDTLTPLQREWIEAFTPDPGSAGGGAAGAGVAPSQEGRQMGDGPRPGGEPGGPRVIFSAANPFTQPPMSDDLAELIALLDGTSESERAP